MRWRWSLVAAAAAASSAPTPLLISSERGGGGLPRTTADAASASSFICTRTERSFADAHRSPHLPPHPPTHGRRRIGVLIVPGEARPAARIRRDEEDDGEEGVEARPPLPRPQPQRQLSRRRKKERPRIPILDYRDDYVCVNKPAGITVHRGRNTPPTSRVLSTSLKRQLSRKVYPVHRLDHRTSGAMLFAFTSERCGELHGMLGAEGATKRYVALLRGKFGGRRRCYKDDGGGGDCLDEDEYVEWDGDDVVTVNKPLTVDGVEKEASTVFTRLASWDGEDGHHLDVDEIPSSGDGKVPKDDGTRADGPLPPREYSGACTLVAATLARGGRTHQIRRHAYRMGHPVIGDSEHGDSRVNRFWRVRRGLDRLALHCLLLDLPPPSPRLRPRGGGMVGDGCGDCDGGEGEDGCGVRCVAPLPDDLASVLRAVGMKTQAKADADTDEASLAVNAATGTTPFWEEAVLREPLLARGFYDFRGGTLGRRRQRERRAVPTGVLMGRDGVRGVATN